MRRRWASAPILCLAALGPTRGAQAVAPPAAAKPYTIQFVFKGLVTLVPVGVTADGAAARELWVLFPAAADTGDVAMQMKHMRNSQLFAMQNGSYPAHHVLLALPKGALAGAGLAASPPVLLQMDARGTSPGYDLRMGGPPGTGANVTLEDFNDIPEVRDGATVAHACANCTSAKAPQPGLYGAPVPLGLRMVFSNGETASVQQHQTQEWTYSEGSEPYRPLPVSVTVTSRPRTGDIQMSIGPLGSGQATPFTITAPTDGSTVVFEVTNAPSGELLDTQEFNPALTELEHFKLAYLLSPKPSNAADRLDYDYDRYIYPRVRKRPTQPGHVSQSNGDPFCTTPNRMQP